MPKWWTDRAEHIREKNPKMPEGMEWALATEQYKEKFGHPPKRHKSSIEDPMNTNKLVSLADSLDKNGLCEEADTLDRIIAQLLGPARDYNDPLSSRFPKSNRPSSNSFDKSKLVAESTTLKIAKDPVFVTAIKAKDFQAAKDFALSVFMNEEGINDTAKQIFENNISQIEEKGASTVQLEKYMWMASLAYGDLGMKRFQELAGKMLILADKLDKKGLFNEADKISNLIVQAGWAFPELESRRPLPLTTTIPVERDPGVLCPECGTSVFSLNKPCSQCGRVGKEKEVIEEL